MNIKEFRKFKEFKEFGTIPPEGTFVLNSLYSLYSLNFPKKRICQ